MRLLASALWSITSDPSIAIVFSITTSGLGAVPTIVKEWHSPETESIAAYLGGIVSGLSAFTAVTAWNLLLVALPSYMVLISVILVAPLLRRKPKPGIDGVSVRSTNKSSTSCKDFLFVGVIGKVSDGLTSLDADYEGTGEVDEVRSWGFREKTNGKKERKKRLAMI